MAEKAAFFAVAVLAHEVSSTSASTFAEGTAAVVVRPTIDPISASIYMDASLEALKPVLPARQLRLVARAGTSVVTCGAICSALAARSQRARRLRGEEAAQAEQARRLRDNQAVQTGQKRVEQKRSAPSSTPQAGVWDFRTQAGSAFIGVGVGAAIGLVRCVARRRRGSKAAGHLVVPLKSEPTAALTSNDVEEAAHNEEPHPELEPEGGLISPGESREAARGEADSWIGGHAPLHHLPSSLGLGTLGLGTAPAPSEPDIPMEDPLSSRPVRGFVRRRRNQYEAAVQTVSEQPGSHAEKDESISSDDLNPKPEGTTWFRISTDAGTDGAEAQRQRSNSSQKTTWIRISTDAGPENELAGA